MNTSSQMGGLISLGGNLENPANSKATDYPDVGAASGPAGMASGQNKLVRLTETQEGPMHTQDSGDGTPSVWGKADFPVGQAKMRGTTMPWKCSLDLESGQLVPNAMEQKY